MRKMDSLTRKCFGSLSSRMKDLIVILPLMNDMRIDLMNSKDINTLTQHKEIIHYIGEI